MKLSLQEADRFYTTLNALFTFAAPSLGCKSVVTSIGGGVDFPAHKDDLKALWERPDLIEKFVKKNPFGLSRADLDVARSWTSAVSGKFAIVLEPGRRAWVLHEDYAFELHGITQEICELLEEDISLVNMTLLPFERHIVFDVTIIELSIDIGPGLRDLFLSSLDDALGEGRVVRTGDELVEMMPIINELAEQRQVDELMADIERIERGEDGELEEGFHRGCLAGLSEDEREAAITADPTGKDIVREYTIKLCDEASIEGEPNDDIAACLLHNTKAELDKIGKECGIKYRGKMRKAKLAEAIAAAVAEKPEIMDSYLEMLSLKKLDVLRDVVTNGGALCVVADEDFSLADVPTPFDPFVFVFKHDGMYEFRIPVPFLAYLQDVDWEAWLEKGRVRESIFKYLDCVLSVRGIGPIGEMYAEWAALTGITSTTRGEFLWAAIDLSLEGSLSAIPCWLNRCSFLADKELFKEFPDNDDLFTFYEQSSAKAGPRPITEEMFAADDIFLWKCHLAQSVAMRTFLDEHVPDEQSDFYYADRIVELVVFMSTGGYAPSAIFDALEAKGLVVPENQAQHFLDLLMGMLNNLPVWDNAGWTPRELLEKESKHRLFFNPDGSVMKVGRNDPCPCGSGKKFKKCCGKL